MLNIQSNQIDELCWDWNGECNRTWFIITAVWVEHRSASDCRTVLWSHSIVAVSFPVTAISFEVFHSGWVSLNELCWIRKKKEIESKQAYFDILAVLYMWLISGSVITMIRSECPIVFCFPVLLNCDQLSNVWFQLRTEKWTLLQPNRHESCETGWVNSNQIGNFHHWFSCLDMRVHCFEAKACIWFSSISR